MFWFKRTDDKDGTNEDTNHLINNVMFSQGSDNSNDNIEIGTEGTKIEMYLDSRGTNNYMSYDAGISDNAWYHIAVTYNMDNTDVCLLYLNGSEINRFNEPSGDLDNSGSSQITIGDTDHNTQPFTGQMDEVAVWSSELSSSQISAIYNGGSGIGDVTTSYSSDLELYIKF